MSAPEFAPRRPGPRPARPRAAFEAMASLAAVGRRQIYADPTRTATVRAASDDYAFETPAGDPIYAVVLHADADASPPATLLRTPSINQATQLLARLRPGSGDTEIRVGGVIVMTPQDLVALSLGAGDDPQAVSPSGLPYQVLRDIAAYDLQRFGAADRSIEHLVGMRLDPLPRMRSYAETREVGGKGLPRDLEAILTTAASRGVAPEQMRRLEEFAGLARDQSGPAALRQAWGRVGSGPPTQEALDEAWRLRRAEMAATIRREITAGLQTVTAAVVGTLLPLRETLLRKWQEFTARPPGGPPPPDHPLYYASAIVDHTGPWRGSRDLPGYVDAYGRGEAIGDHLVFAERLPDERPGAEALVERANGFRGSAAGRFVGERQRDFVAEGLVLLERSMDEADALEAGTVETATTVRLAGAVFGSIYEGLNRVPAPGRAWLDLLSAAQTRRLLATHLATPARREQFLEGMRASFLPDQRPGPALVARADAAVVAMRQHVADLSVRPSAHDPATWLAGIEMSPAELIAASRRASLGGASALRHAGGSADVQAVLIAERGLAQAGREAGHHLHGDGPDREQRLRGSVRMAGRSLAALSEHLGTNDYAELMRHAASTELSLGGNLLVDAARRASFVAGFADAAEHLAGRRALAPASPMVEAIEKEHLLSQVLERLYPSSPPASPVPPAAPVQATASQIAASFVDRAPPLGTRVEVREVLIDRAGEVVWRKPELVAAAAAETAAAPVLNHALFGAARDSDPDDDEDIGQNFNIGDF